jgi:hypothetical protein
MQIIGFNSDMDSNSISMKIYSHTLFVNRMVIERRDFLVKNSLEGIYSLLVES